MATTKHTKETIIDTFKIWLVSIFKISPNLLGTGTILFSLFISIIFFVIIIWINVNPYKLILDLANQIISFVPSFLGFSIGGYAFLIGFNQASLINKISEPQKKSKYSLYQQASAAFAVCLLIQAFTLCVGYLIHFITYLDEEKKLYKYFSEKTISILNYSSLLITLVFFITSLLVVIQIILNIFNFSQLYHYNINKEKIDEESNNSKRDNKVSL